jgi:hemerythrin-like domain-containing protein
VLRDKSLIPLSHQHQHALALCVRIDRAVQAGNPDVPAFQAEIQQMFDQEIRIHFEAEEKIVFPAAEIFSELKRLVAELLAEHAVLRELFGIARSGQLDSDLLKKVAGMLSAHIRKEERQLFERMQSLLTTEQMAEMGSALDKALASVQQACLLPNAATRLRGKGEEGS